MKKEIMIVMAVAATLVGCQRNDTELNEPAGADRPMRTNQSEAITEPSGAERSTLQQDSTDLQSGAAASDAQSGAAPSQSTNDVKDASEQQQPDLKSKDQPYSNP